ncbi:DegT/DnrJ/EryC1/StrS family aminotransferase [Herbaspirillum lusitanum]|uniref:DegT/DnrJ/EryC1/StrS family aminotransferase n=1 Tax=Herbaspirillum lusitanum TaxID=213312 RepID=UPI0003773492|nr:DegT/DnrJ/EryC1/StrS family aminotransferase [Herbaspirillum lusitanum]
MSTIRNVGKDLAVFGAAPAMPQLLRPGQEYFPEWSRYEIAFRDIFTRQYYTNHGPLAQRLEARLAEYLSVAHAMCITNEAIALCLAAQALRLHGKVLVPGISDIFTAQSLAWADAEPVFCDVDADTGMLSAEAAKIHLEKGGINAILAVNAWGGAADASALQELADRYDIPLYFDSSQAFGSSTDGVSLGGRGRLEVFSLQSAHVLSCGEGAFIATNDDDLAAHVRNIRSNYGMGRPVPVVKTSNGRFSEAQAAIALMSFDDLEIHIANNGLLAARYAASLSGIPGVTIRKAVGVDRSNQQCLMLAIDEVQFGLSAQALRKVLRAENIESSSRLASGWYRHGTHAVSVGALPIADSLCASLLELPIGAKTDADKVALIADIIRQAHIQADRVRNVVEALG